MYALILQGHQGTGKTALARLAKRAIGYANIVEPSNDEVNGRWTSWQEGASLAIIEELMTKGRLEMANRLKTVITNDTLRIEGKGQHLYSIPNHLNLLGFTNYKDAVKLEGGDRRWLVLFSSMKPQPQSYYDRLFEWIDSREAPGIFRHMLENRKPSLNPKGRAPHTSAKEEMMEASLTEAESLIEEWAQSTTGPFKYELFRFEDVRNALPPKDRGNHLIRRALERIGAQKHTRNTNTSDNLPKLQLWSVRNHAEWKKAGPVGRVRAFLEMHDLTPNEFEMLE